MNEDSWEDGVSSISALKNSIDLSSDSDDLRSLEADLRESGMSSASVG